MMNLKANMYQPKNIPGITFLNSWGEDVAFGFEKALDKRGLSSAMMFNVVSFWNWILEEGLEDFSDDNYAQYGLPLFKATAVKYGWENPIEDDEGNEYKYSQEYDQGDEDED